VSGWADDPIGRLRSVEEKVAGVQSALGPGGLAAGTASADELVALTTELLEELDVDRHQDSDADAELLAALRVYRNAAFTFRKLAGSDPGSDPPLRAVCQAIIEQGHDHLQAYLDVRDEPR